MCRWIIYLNSTVVYLPWQQRHQHGELRPAADCDFTCVTLQVMCSCSGWLLPRWLVFCSFTAIRSQSCIDAVIYYLFAGGIVHVGASGSVPLHQAMWVVLNSVWLAMWVVLNSVWLAMWVVLNSVWLALLENCNTGEYMWDTSPFTRNNWNIRSLQCSNRFPYK